MSGRRRGCISKKETEDRLVLNNPKVAQERLGHSATNVTLDVYRATCSPEWGQRDSALAQEKEFAQLSWFQEVGERSRHTGSPGTYSLYLGNALDVYGKWPTPATIISDGAYGVGGFPSDPRTPDGLADWYRPHVEAWSRYAHPATTLWFWNTEIGWATVHPLLVACGWQYEFACVWNKGVAHVAGNVNGKTLRRLPIVTEVCVFYSRKVTIPTKDGPKHVKDWIRYEWARTGLPFHRANEACGVKNAATRKYLTTDWLWYFPPSEMMEKLARYANEKGDPRGRPYFSLDGVNPVTAEEWAKLRYKWNHKHGVTNVWEHPPLHNGERIRGTGKRSAPRVYKPSLSAAAHLNQKPLAIMALIIEVSTDPGDTVWEPFGGLCSATVAAVKLGRNAYAAEIEPDFYELAVARLQTVKSHGAIMPTDHHDISN